MGKTAILLGATGLTGGYLLNLLLETPEFESVLLFSRKSVNMVHPKLEEYLVDLLRFEDKTEFFKGDVVFCCIGTTQAKTKDKELYKAIDYGIPVTAAKMAAKNGIECFLVISAMGASSSSSVFYNKTKGQMEEDVLKQEIAHTYILRPSLIGGDRNESRLGERIAQLLMGTFGFLIPKKYRMIHPETIAKAMLTLTQTVPDRNVYLSDEIKEVASHG
jgi:uncharacterized protein YbjT (DUF2867 family)